MDVLYLEDVNGRDLGECVRKTKQKVDLGLLSRLPLTRSWLNPRRLIYNDLCQLAGEMDEFTGRRAAVVGDVETVNGKNLVNVSFYKSS